MELEKTYGSEQELIEAIKELGGIATPQTDEDGDEVTAFDVKLPDGKTYEVAYEIRVRVTGMARYIEDGGERFYTR
jgi:hypothetical protein